VCVCVWFVYIGEIRGAEFTSFSGFTGTKVHILAVDQQASPVSCISVIWAFYAANACALEALSY
jgi:hypothetical protein